MRIKTTASGMVFVNCSFSIGMVISFGNFELPENLSVLITIGST
jgi:hypothetical protein